MNRRRLVCDSSLQDLYYSQIAAHWPANASIRRQPLDTRSKGATARHERMTLCALDGTK